MPFHLLSPDQLTALFDALGDGVFVAGEGGRILSINLAGARALGFDSPEEITSATGGAKLSALFPALGSGINEVLALGQVRVDRIVEESENRQPFIFELVLSPLPAAEPRVAGIFRDVTAQVKNVRDATARNRELEALRRLAVDAMRMDEQEPLLKSMLEVCIEAVGASGGCIFVYDAATKKLKRSVWQGGPEEITEKRYTVSLGQGLSGKVAVTRTPVHMGDVAAAGPTEKDLPPAPGLRSYASLPLLVKKRLLGVIDFTSVGDRYLGPREFLLLQGLAAQVSLSLDHLVRMEELVDRNAELEKFNRLAVDRELRMIELKKRIRELETGEALAIPNSVA